MPRITVLHKDGSPQELDAPLGLSVMEICQKARIDEVEGACGGALACGTCHVYIHPDWWAKCLPDGERSADEEDMLDLAFDIRPRSRLCCQIRMTDELDRLVIAVPGANVDWK